MSRLVLIVASFALVAGATVGCRGQSASQAPGPDPSNQRATDTTVPATLPAPPAQRPKPGATTGELTFGGAVRTHRLFLPSLVTNGAPIPLLIGLHGGLGTGAQFAEATDFQNLAEREGFIAAFPDGIGRTWNGGRCCGQAAREQVDDVGYLAALIDKLAAEFPVDRNQVFLTGHSNGAIMAWRFACERPDLIAAAAPVAGSLEVSRCPAPNGTSLLVIHGDADRNHPLEGGEGSRSIAGVAFTSVASSLALWTGSMGCVQLTETRAEGALTTTDYSGCKDGSRTRLVVVAGADHSWPGSTLVRVSELQGEPSKALDATAAVWAFFAEVSGP